MSVSKHPPRSLARLVEIVWQATVPLRDGPQVVTRDEGFTKVEEVFDFPSVEDGVQTAGVVATINMTLFTVGILPDAESLKTDFLRAIQAYPDMERLIGGPSYIEIGYHLADYDDQAQLVAIMMIALGEHYKLWTAITPNRLGIEGGGAQEMARSGFIMLSSPNLPDPDKALV